MKNMDGRDEEDIRKSEGFLIILFIPFIPFIHVNSLVFFPNAWPG